MKWIQYNFSYLRRRAVFSNNNSKRLIKVTNDIISEISHSNLSKDDFIDFVDLLVFHKIHSIV